MSVFIIITLVSLLGCMLLAFGESDPESESELCGDADLNVGEFSVTVPQGWLAIPVMNMFGDNPNAPKTDTVKLCKGAVSPFDLFSKPNMEIIFYDKVQGVMPPKSVYREVSELVPFVTGEHVWAGFRASAFAGKKLTLLWEDTGVFQYQVNIWTDGDDSSISLTDEDVIKILASIVPNTVD